MKKNLKQQGFTFIEVIVTLFLFSLLMGVLWQFFGNAFTTYVQFDQQTNLTDHSRIVNSFIREEIRSADQITIVTTGSGIVGFSGEIHPPAASRISRTSESSLGLVDVELAEIQLYTTGTGIRTGAAARNIELKRNTPVKVGQGKYSLIYKANSTESLISDKVENIKITREEDSPIVQFECIIHKEGETEDRFKVKNIFSESLEYKMKRTP